MGLFGSRASDDEWLRAVMPFYLAARSFVKVLNGAVMQVNMIQRQVEQRRSTDKGHPALGPEASAATPYQLRELEEMARAVARVRDSLSPVVRSVRSLPRPTSTEVRQVRVSLELALRLYLRCARRLVKVLRDLTGKFGRKYVSGRQFEGKAMALQTASINRLTDKAATNFQSAATYLDSRTNLPQTSGSL